MLLLPFPQAYISSSLPCFQTFSTKFTSFQDFVKDFLSDSSPKFSIWNSQSKRELQ